MTGCWYWTDGHYWNGYGMAYSPVRKRQVRAHRYAYELLVGPIPRGRDLDHLCRQRNCVNPDHLRPATRRENLLAPGSKSPAAIHAVKTECPRGHAYDAKNTAIRRNGSRRCKACHVIEEQRRNSARRTIPTCAAGDQGPKEAVTAGASSSVIPLVAPPGGNELSH